MATRSRVLAQIPWTEELMAAVRPKSATEQLKYMKQQGPAALHWAPAAQYFVMIYDGKSGKHVRNV